MFKFAKIIHLDNDKKDYEYKPDKKQEFKTFSLTLWNDPQKTKPISSFNLNRFNQEKEKSKSIEDFNINKFNEPKTAEPKYEKFTSSKDVKPYDLQKGRYNNINTEDLLYKANITDQLANKIDSPDLDRLKQEILARINLDDPNQDEHIQNLLNANMPKIMKKTRTGKSIMKQKVVNEIKDLQEQQLNSGLEIKPIEPRQRRKIKQKIYKQDLDVYNDLNDKQKYQLRKDLDKFLKPIEEAKQNSKLRQKIKQDIKEKAEQTIRKAIKTRQQKKKAEKATKILQARFRGRQVRLGKNQEGQNYLQAKNERNTQRNQEKNENATKIQKIIRVRQAKNKAKKLREEIFNKEMENQEIKKVRNKKLGIVEPEIIEAEPIQAEPLPLGEMSENLNKLQNNAFLYLEKFLNGDYTESTFNQKIKVNTLREICKLSNINYNGKTKPQMIKLIKEQLSS